jgi:hypothetical protein
MVSPEYSIGIIRQASDVERRHKSADRIAA